MDQFTRPQPTPTSVEPAATAPSAVQAIRTEDHVVWDEPDLVSFDRVEGRFVVVSWLLAVALTVAIFAVSAMIVAALSARPLTGETNTELGVLTILAAMSTFIGFVVVMTLRLVRVEHDRVMNSLAVAGLHIGVALLLFLGDLGAEAWLGTAPSSVFEGTWTDQIGNAFVVLERSAAAAVISCLLAIGMVPAHGARPRGTQVAPTPQDEQL